jgi:hypothetical protein
MAQAKRHCITRRCLIAASAAVPVAAVAPVLSSVAVSDPIFAAIAEHRRAYADLLALFDAQAAADKAGLAARLDQLCAAEGPLGQMEMAATDRLARTVPQSLAGAAAALRYVRERFERDAYPLYEEDGYRVLLLSTERAICRALQFT